MNSRKPNSIDTTARREPAAYLELSFVVLLGAITRFLAVALITKQYEPSWLFTRGTEMGFMAVSLLRGDGLGSPFGGHTGPTAMIGPAYPIFVAGVFKLFGAYSGRAAMAIMVVQAVVSLLNLWLILLLAKRLWAKDRKAGQRAALVAGLFWALSPAVFYMSSILWDTTFTACMVTGALLLAIGLQQSPTRFRLLGLSGFCGLAYLINPALLLVTGALLTWASIQVFRRTNINPTPAIVVFLLLCSPWPIRNVVTMHAFIPIRECLGIELNMGNHPGSDGHLEESMFPLFNSAELAEYKQVGEVRYVQHKALQAESHIASHPQAFVRLTAIRFVRFWSGTGTRGGSSLFAFDAIPTALLGLLGLVWLWKEQRPFAVPFVIVCVLFPLPYYVTHAEFRYRLTLDPLLLPLSGYALLSAVGWVRERAFSQPVAADGVSACVETRNFFAEQSGQTFIVAAVSMVVLVACLGLAVDVGHLRYEKRHLQQAADAAALAAGLELNVCGTSHNCTAMQRAAQTAASENGYPPAATTLSCASSGITGVVLTINNPACATGATDSNNGNPSYVEVVMTENVSAYFAPVIGFNSFPIAVRAEAGRAAAPCIYALDRTPLATGITVAGLASVNADCPIVDESNAPLTAFNCVLGSVAATKITVGGTFGILSPAACTVTPAPQINTPLPTPADPLAYVLQNNPIAVPNTCTGSPSIGLTYLYVNTTATLNPGRYCGGITIGPLANVTFNPGVYVLTNTSVVNLVGLTGGLSITAGANVYGNGVVFYNDNTALLPNATGGITFAGNLPLGGLGNITLIAPNSTNTIPATIPYQGLLFLQDSNDTAPASIAASTGMNTKLEGAFYFPNAPITYAVAGNARFNILVAKDITFGPVTFGGTAYENSVFGKDYSQLTNGSPIPANAAVLVQ